MYLKGTDFKDFNDIALMYCKVIDMIVFNPKFENSYEFVGGRKGSQDKPRELLISAKTYDGIMKIMCGKKVNKYKSAFTTLGFIEVTSKGAKRYRTVNGKKQKVIVVLEEMYDFVDEMINYSEVSDKWEERIRARLTYKPPLLGTPR